MLIDANPESPTYGYITSTPKPGWSNANILGMLREKLSVPIVVDMDVVVAGLGEAKWGASKNDSHSLYLTIGTGIGGGYIVDGKPFHGLTSLEMGHIRIPHDFGLDPFRGACPYHGDCFEGLAAGPAIEARLGQRAETGAADGDLAAVVALGVVELEAASGGAFSARPRKASANTSPKADPCTAPAANPTSTGARCCDST